MQQTKQLTKTDIDFATSLIYEVYGDLSLEDIQSRLLELDIYLSIPELIDYYQLQIDIVDKEINYKVNT